MKAIDHLNRAIERVRSGDRATVTLTKKDLDLLAGVEPEVELSDKMFTEKRLVRDEDDLLLWGEN